MIPAQVKALQGEVRRLIAQLDELHAKCERQEGLLREALVYVPRVEHGWTETVKFSDLGNRIEAELGAGPGPPA
jgi:hypothetical protein